jgi:hypothetical protein
VVVEAHLTVVFQDTLGLQVESGDLQLTAQLGRELLVLAVVVVELEPREKLVKMEVQAAAGIVEAELDN